MRRILFTSLMLAACAGAAAQNVGEAPMATFYDYGFWGHFVTIPAEFTKDGNGLFALSNNYLGEGYTSSFDIYNDDFEMVSTVTMEVESYREYSIIKERGSYTDPFEGTIYNGTWSERREYDDEKMTDVENIVVETNNLGSDRNYIYITQTLFNDDEDYEYILPIVKVQKANTYEEDRDGNGEVDYIRNYYHGYKVGFNIKSINGNTLQTIDIENDRYIETIYLIMINDKKYLGIETYDINGEYIDELIIYPIKPNNTGINPLGAPMKMKVSPRMADRSESFTVELDGESNAEREVVVVNSAGQTVWKQKVPTGQRTVTIGAARLGKGVNVVRVSGGKGAESCKVIVK